MKCLLKTYNKQDRKLPQVGSLKIILLLTSALTFNLSVLEAVSASLTLPQELKKVELVVRVEHRLVQMQMTTSKWFDVK